MTKARRGSARELEQGRDVAVLCEGDPFALRLVRAAVRAPGRALPDRGRAGRDVVHGRRGRGARPLVGRSQTLAVLPGDAAGAMRSRPSSRGTTARRSSSSAGTSPRSVEVLAELGLLERAIYVEHASAARERVRASGRSRRRRSAVLRPDPAARRPAIMSAPARSCCSARAALAVAERIAARGRTRELHAPAERMPAARI